MEYTKEELDCMNEYHKMILDEILIKAELMSDNYDKMKKETQEYIEKCFDILLKEIFLLRKEVEKMHKDIKEVKDKAKIW